MNELEKEIFALLEQCGKLKAKDIAKKLGLTKTEVNSFLYSSENFAPDSDYKWLPIQQPITLTLPDKWVTSSIFENHLESCGCPTSSKNQSFTVKLLPECKLMLDTGVKLLTLLNQLASLGKSACIDLTECRATKSYLNRAGFFDTLDSRVKVLPSRPRQSTAKLFNKNSKTLVELEFIHPSSPNNAIPSELAETVKSWTSDEMYGPVYTIFSELFGNVCDHSRTKIPGIAGSQMYKGTRRRIQTIISDSGVGICTELREALRKDPNRKKEAKLNDCDLIIQTLTKGGLTRHDPSKEDGHGLGLKRSGDSAIKLNATVSIRQKDFYLVLSYEDGQFLVVKERKSVPLIEGTHICFEFYID